MAYNRQDDFALGRNGSAFVTGTSAFTPPSGMVIAAIYCLSGQCKVAANGLIPEKPGDATYKFPASAAGVAEPGGLSMGTVDGSAAATNTAAANGAQAGTFQSYPSGSGTGALAKGMTLFGRWTSLKWQTAGARAIVYFSY